MPIYLYWGDDEMGYLMAVDKLIKKVVDSTWIEANLSRFNGSDETQITRALEESITLPFGKGDRVIVLHNSSLCNDPYPKLIYQLEAHIKLIPFRCHLIFWSLKKPDPNLKATKILKEVAEEKSFILPKQWNHSGQINIVKETAKSLGLFLNTQVAEELYSVTDGNPIKLKNEMEKLDIYSTTKNITSESVNYLMQGQTVSIQKIGILLIENSIGDAIELIDILLNKNESPIKIVVSLSKLVRTWLWVSLLTQEGEHNIEIIAQKAGIVNPKSIYIIRKQIKDYAPETLLYILRQLLGIEMELKRGVHSKDAFRDGLLIQINS
uniref:DNA polymerase III subunit delta n=1 Tax=Paulinella longichromatophora TaxID=1708747 RepID=A0A2H4ZPH5_9EUKA|nr:hypothetical protein PLO_439 [Paulinella longichromatophora]